MKSVAWLTELISGKCVPCRDAVTGPRMGIQLARTVLIDCISG